MLARSFKTATDLGIVEAEYDSLITVLHMLERGELVEVPRSERFNVSVPNGFCMSSVSHKSACGTVGCIMGWCQIVTKNNRLFDFYDGSKRPQQVAELFMFGDERRHAVTLDQATRGLSNYLMTGNARWDDVLRSQ